MKENYKRFDVVLVDFGQVEFAGEQGGKRPALILQRDEEKGLKVDSMVLGECLRQVSEQRIIKKLGYISSIEDKRNIKRVYDANFGVLEEA